MDGFKLKAHRANHAMRMSQRYRAICRLKEMVITGTSSDKIKVSDVRKIIQENYSLSIQECGYVVRKAFTKVKRRRTHSTWYYYGLVFRKTSPTANNVRSVSSVQNKTFSKEKALKKSKENKLLPKDALPYRIPCFNICLQDMSLLEECTLVGEGSFGKCVSGTYKDIPVAIKVFKDDISARSVHHEANVLLKIPSHPNIAMLIGVHSVGKPYLLLTKLCLSNDRPETYSHYLFTLKDFDEINVKQCFKLLSEIADALNHIHSHGIIHNDLKGNNVVVEGTEKDRHAVLIDFGKAGPTQLVPLASNKSCREKRTESELQKYKLQFPHIAPEVAKGESKSTKSDIFSFGYLFCNTLKKFRAILEQLENHHSYLQLGKGLTSPYLDKRPSLGVVLSTLSSNN